MKVLYILHRTVMDGSALSFLTMLEGLLKCGYSAVAVIPDEKYELVNRLKDLHIPYYVVPMEFYVWPSFCGIKRFVGYPIVLLRMLKRLRYSRRLLGSIVRMEQPDVIHTNVSPINIGHYVANKYGIPHVWHVREYCDTGLHLHLFPSKNYYEKQMKRDYTICITKDLQKHYCLEGKDSSVVIYDGIRSISEIAYFPCKKNYFLCASRLSEEKAIDKSILVFSRFFTNHKDYSLVLLGEGYDYYVNQLKNLVESLGLTGKVVFKGYTDKVDSYMREAKALLVASPSEGFGRMTAEAAFAGCISIGYNSAGTKEILQNIGGFLWEDEEEYLSSMERVASMSEQQYTDMIRNAQEKVVHYSNENHIKEICEFYISISDRRNM